MHSVLIIDDHDIVRLGLEALLSRCPDLTLAGWADNLQSGLAQIHRQCPALVISDMGLGDSHGLETVRALAQAQGTRRLLVVTMQDEMLYGEQALALGANGYLMKGSVQANLVPAVLTILHGGTWTSPRLNARMVDRYLRRNTGAKARAEEGVSSLSARELQVLELLRSGKTTKEIADQLQLSSRTVDIHRANMKKKLKLRTGAELIAFASRRA
ncbi:response regulator transcription factor [Ramlibacter sp. XY19]|uniref:LuxR C-terminal-related transcriptional regulator n=1 Tax=Ramlibacter paludis TaxID=2908000 RepID=UPI0023DA87A7|nr:response regulator transcription factor [Ramlibacter paludis]MCG2595065.1 response regulator transcription factor [Ramlibacter paludis]